MQKRDSCVGREQHEQPVNFAAVVKIVNLLKHYRKANWMSLDWIECRVSLIIDCWDGRVRIERTTKFLAVPRVGDLITDIEDKNSLIFVSGLEVEQVEFCISSGDIQVCCDDYTWPKATIDDILTRFPGFHIQATPD